MNTIGEGARVKGDFEVSISKIVTPFSFLKSHTHDYYEIYYLMSGRRRLYIGNQCYSLKKGSLAFIPKNVPHKTMTASPPEHERLVIYFHDAYIDSAVKEQPDLLLPFSGQEPVLELNQQEQAFVENLLLQMINEYSDKDRRGRALYFKSLLTQLLLFAGRKQPDGSTEELKPVNPSIREIVQHCNDHFREPMTLGQIAGRFFLSPSYVSRLLKKYTGHSFPEYLNTLRIRESQRLLRETGLKMIEIAEQVGYLNITHFNKNFKLITGMSPLQYKKMAQNMEHVTLKHKPEFLEKHRF
ncbi:AraC family transcriptional regulator [Paenibacillus mucilaginosus 3016]|uniref:AraC family transcriptional regulator n=2 Tax=Paenibacillus mucilaginosus TaxID=61624 RepID=H6NI48_9BACL|nr:AraC family transcriptional regulator [Paenibacillus mucilaginosus]AFC30819.1 AraC family transcriptional regulator [Paenibacillus mucilaginosus 3016]AFH63141.1 AraC family transcriptional regulator [Paenibacillus mucilaginosus K02]WFA19424.1 AraC family transcriptional regulator [Paenibacillus mucilaginosus]